MASGRGNAHVDRGRIVELVKLVGDHGTRNPVGDGRGIWAHVGLGKRGHHGGGGYTGWWVPIIERWLIAHGPRVAEELEVQVGVEGARCALV